MGPVELSLRGSIALPQLHSPPGMGSHRPHRRRWGYQRRTLQHTRRPAGNPRRPYRRLRWPSRRLTRSRSSASRGRGRPHRRALVPHLPPALRPGNRSRLRQLRTPHRPDQPHRLLPDRLHHRQRRLRSDPAGRPRQIPRRTSSASSPSSPAAPPRSTPGTRSSSSPCRSITSNAGRCPACSASETPPTPCRPSAASASTSPCRTPSPPPTCSPNRSAPARSRPSISSRSSVIAKAPSITRSGYRFSRTASSTASCNNPGPIKPALLLRIATALPRSQRSAAHFVGMGLQPEHIQTKPA